MSVPPRSVLTVQREELRGRRYRVAIGASAMGHAGWPDDAVLTRCFREDGAACALALLSPPAADDCELRKQIAVYRRDANALATLRRLCETALSSLRSAGRLRVLRRGDARLRPRHRIRGGGDRDSRGPFRSALPSRPVRAVADHGRCASRCSFPLLEEDRGASMNDLTARVLNAIPAGAFEMNALLSLLRIEETDAVPTASVSCERRPVLRINPDFVRRHCRTDEHLFLLVMHELHHVLLGHTRLFPRATRAHNLAFDALINAMLVLRFPAEAYRSFFLDLYGGEEGPMRLLAPPAGPRDHGRRAVPPPPRAVRGRAARRRRRCSTRSSRRWPSSWRATRSAATTVLLGFARGRRRRWVGDRGPLTSPVHRVRFAASSRSGRRRSRRSAAGAWPRRCRARTSHRTGRGVEVLATLRRALLGAATKRTAGPPRVAWQDVSVQDAVPSASDRRAAVVRTCGAQPLLYWRPAQLASAGAWAGRGCTSTSAAAWRLRAVPLRRARRPARLRRTRRAPLLDGRDADRTEGPATWARRHDRRDGHPLRARSRARRTGPQGAHRDGWLRRAADARAGEGDPAGRRGGPCGADTGGMAQRSGRDLGADGRTAGAWPAPASTRRAS